MRSYKRGMDKEHLIDLIFDSLIEETKHLQSINNQIEIKNYLHSLNLLQLRTMSKEFIL